MSALVSSQGGVFVTETGARSASVGGAFLTETVSVGAIVDLGGDLAFSVPLAADLTVVGGGTVNYVDFSGNLGGVSHYDRLKYGLGHYSRIDAFAPIFAADALDIVGTDEFAGALAPVVTFAGALDRLPGLAGDLAPVVTFTGDLTLLPYVDFAGELAPTVTFGATVGLQVDLAGDLAPQVSLDGTLSLAAVDAFLDGSIGLSVVLGASELISHPLWEEGEPCPPPDWEPSEPCPPPAWASSAPPAATWTPTEKPPSLWTPVGPCDPVEWEETVE